MAQNRRGLEIIIPYFFILVNHIILKVDKSFQLLDKCREIGYNMRRKSYYVSLCGFAA